MPVAHLITCDLDLWSRGQWMLSACHALYVYQLRCWQLKLFSVWSKERQTRCSQNIYCTQSQAPLITLSMHQPLPLKQYMFSNDTTGVHTVTEVQTKLAAQYGSTTLTVTHAADTVTVIRCFAAVVCTKINHRCELGFRTLSQPLNLTIPV